MESRRANGWKMRVGLGRSGAGLAAGLLASLVLAEAGRAHLSMIRQGVESAELPENGDKMGWGVARGDFNGDGYGDLATAAPSEKLSSSGAIRDGVVIVSWGTRHGPTHIGAQLLAPNQTSAEKGFGSDLAVADFDQDGIDDLAVGLINSYFGNISFAGKVHLYRGTPGGLVLFDVLDQTQAGGVNEASDWFGDTLAAGDIDGNGWPDLVVGAPGEDGEAGAIYWFRNGPFGMGSLGSGMIQQSTYGDTDEPVDRFGSRIVIGQFTGFPQLGGGVNPRDIAVSAPYKDVSGLFGAKDMGAVTIISGVDGGNPDGANAQRYTPISFGLTSTNNEDAHFGFSLATGHFGLSGAFHSGLVVGATGDGSGRVHVLSGGTTTLSYEGELRGSDHGFTESGFDEFGWSVAAGDFDGDGTDEIAVGNNAGTTDERVVVYETGPGGVTATGGQVFEKHDFGEPDASHSDFGWVLAFGELDDTGREALVIGAPEHDIGGAAFIAAPWRQVLGGHFAAAAVRDCDGIAVFSRRPMERVFVEDTGKVLAALVAAERTQLPTSDPSWFDANAIVTVPAVATTGNTNAFGLVAGEELRLVDLLALTLMSPADDAAKAMAQILGGSIAAFQAEMQSRGWALGMNDTVGIQPSGQPSATSSGESNPWDMSILAREARKNTVVSGIVGSSSWTFTRQIPDGVGGFTPQPTTVFNSTTPALQAILAEATGLVTGVGGRTGLYSGRELAAPWGKGVAAMFGRPQDQAGTAVQEAVDLLSLGLLQCTLSGFANANTWKDDYEVLKPVGDATLHVVDVPSDAGATLRSLKLHDPIQDGAPVELQLQAKRTSDVLLPAGTPATYRTIGFGSHDEIAIANTGDDDASILVTGTTILGGGIVLDLVPGEVGTVPGGAAPTGIVSLSLRGLTVDELSLRVVECYTEPVVLKATEPGFDVSFDQSDARIVPHSLRVSLTGMDDDLGHFVGMLVTSDPDAEYDVCRARFDEYGFGWPGRHGVPLLSASSAPVLGGTTEIWLGNSLHEDTSAFWAIGFLPNAAPTTAGGTLLVKPFQVLPIALPASGFSFPWPVPSDPTLCGVTFYDQLFVVDPDASHGLSFSRGLKLTMGS